MVSKDRKCVCSLNGLDDGADQSDIQSTIKIRKAVIKSDVWESKIGQRIRCSRDSLSLEDVSKSGH